MKEASALTLVAAVFLIGLAGGLLGGRLVNAPATEPPERPRGFPPLRGAFLPESLDLSPEQQERVHEVFAHQRRRFEQLHEELRPEVEALLAETDAAIVEILDAEQLKQYRRRRGRWRRGWGPPDKHGTSRGLRPERPPAPSSE